MTSFLLPYGSTEFAALVAKVGGMGGGKAGPEMPKPHEYTGHASLGFRVIRLNVQR